MADVATTKWCPRCEQHLSVEEFYLRSDRPGYSSYCRPCMKDYSTTRNREKGTWHVSLKRRYGMTVKDYADMLLKQDGKCAICQKEMLVDGERLHVDHDHACCPGENSCGECIRGLLCASCNRGLGNFQDDPDALIAAAMYLAKDSDGR